MDTTMRTRVLLVGIGGASCSGKTLLAKHLQRLLPTSLLVHQDDFAPTAETVPVHAVHGVEDWDDPDTCIEWTRWRALLAHIRACGALPEGHASWDHLNAQTEVDVPAQVVAGCARALDEEIGAAGERGERVLVVLVDGFVLYYDALARGLLDVQILLRVPRETLRERREGRAVYALQNATDAAQGTIWTDPPNYFSQIVYPAYVKAHAHLFAGGDVEAGPLRAERNPGGDGVGDEAVTEPEVGIQAAIGGQGGHRNSGSITLVEPAPGPVGMAEALGVAVEAVVRAVKEGRGVVVE